MKNYLKERINKIIFPLYFLLIINLFIFPSLSQNECDYHFPVRIEESKECVKGDDFYEIHYKRNECFIDNSIVKTQLINNLRMFEELDYQYIDIKTTFNGNLISLTTSSADDNQYGKLFYCLNKEDGRGYFSDTPYKLTSQVVREYINIFSVKKKGNTDNKEYIGSLSIDEDNEFEVYDDYITYTSTSISLFDCKYFSHVSSIFELNNENLFCGIIGQKDGKNYFYITKFAFTRFSDVPKSDIEFTIKYECSNSKIVSCCQSDNKNIMCFYQYINNSYVEVIFDQNMSFQLNKTIVDENIEENKYFEGVHFTGEVCAFIYYDQQNKANLFFKNFNEEVLDLVNYFEFGKIELNLNDPNIDISLNDLIKLNDSKICFTSINGDKKDLYITIIHEYDKVNKKIKIKYYLIHMFNLYHYKFNKILSTTIYNDFLVLGSSFSQLDYGKWDATSIILFSYPNSKDFDFDIMEHLQIPKNLTIDLNSICVIENNIFGLIYYGIKIINFENEYILLSSKNYRKINIGEYIYENENIVFVLSKNLTSGKIVFAMEAIEPNYTTHIKYFNSSTNINENDTEENYYSPKRYIGRHSYCNIILEENSIFDDCNDNNCELCLINKTCIKCKDNFKFYHDGNSFICSEITEETETPKNNIETTTIDNIETTTIDKIETTTLDNLVTTLDNMETTTIDSIETTNINSIETSTIDNIETTIDNGETSTIDSIETTNINDIETTTKNSIEASTIDSIETTILDSIENTKIIIKFIPLNKSFYS